MNYLELLHKLEDYYTNLLIVQYNGKPKATAHIKMLVNLIWVNMIFFQVRDAFDWETAGQAQLDIIGKWIGIDKFYKGQLFDFHAWFSLTDYDTSPDNLQGGFSTFETFDTVSGGVLDYEEILPTQNKMPTKTFRQLIGLKIIYNSISFTCKAIDEAIWDYFNGQVYTTWIPASHKLIYTYPSSLNEIFEVAYDKGILPCPPTVSIQLQEIIENE